MCYSSLEYWGTLGRKIICTTDQFEYIWWWFGKFVELIVWCAYGGIWSMQTMEAFKCVCRVELNCGVGCVIADDSINE